MIDESIPLPAWFRLYKQFNDKLSHAIGILGEIVIAVSALIILSTVLFRFSQFNLSALTDIPTLLMPWLIFPSAAKLLRGNQHIKVDAIHSLLGKQNKIYLELISLLLSTAICIGFFLIGIKGVQFFALIGQNTYTEIAIPIWYFQLAFPIGFGLAANFAVEGVIEHIFSLSHQTSIKNEV